MTALPPLCPLLGNELYGTIMEESTRIYHDFRFYIVLLAFGTLALLTLDSYPL